MLLAFTTGHRLPLGMALLVSMLTLFVQLSMTPAITASSVQLSVAEEQLTDGTGKGMGVFWVVVGVAGVVVGACILAPILPALVTGTAALAITVKGLAALGTIGAGLASVAHGARQLE